MAKDVIIACDFAGEAETMAFLDQFQEEKPFVKIGMELCYISLVSQFLHKIISGKLPQYEYNDFINITFHKRWSDALSEATIL